MQNETNIFTDNGLANIFKGGVFSNQPIGFRWEGEQAENCLVYSRNHQDKNGVYSTKCFIFGINRRGKKNKSSMFPKEWTREKVIKAISEAYETRKVKSGQNFILGESASGLKIRLWLDENGKVFDAMPMRVNELGEIQTKAKKRNRCKICGQPRNSVCFKHGNFPRPKITELIWKRLRYYSRKLYFNFVRRLGFIS